MLKDANLTLGYCFLLDSRRLPSNGTFPANGVCQVITLDNRIVDFAYDQRGNLTQGDGLTLTYNHFDKPIRVLGTGAGNHHASNATDIKVGLNTEANANNTHANNAFTDLNKNNHYRRGFTGHEHLNEQQLIHMNGRMYDYNLGRFLSVDPFIQSPGNTQSVNPYAYIMNNPLAGTDPTGYLAESVCAHHGAEYYCSTMSFDSANNKAPKKANPKGIPNGILNKESKFSIAGDSTDKLSLTEIASQSQHRLEEDSIPTTLIGIDDNTYYFQDVLPRDVFGGLTLLQPGSDRNEKIILIGYVSVKPYSLLLQVESCYFVH